MATSEKGLIDRNGLVLGGVGEKNIGMGAQLTDESLAVIMGTTAPRVVDQGLATRVAYRQKPSTI
jgi:hypothetical protein